MTRPHQISRPALAWLLLAQAVILLPHSVHMPLWLWAAWLWVVFWRWQIFRGAWNFPSLVVRFGLMLALGGALLLDYGGRFDMTAMVGLLLAGFVLKLLELRRYRDLLVSVYLGYFVTATQFLFHSGPLAALYGGLSLLVLTASLLAAHQSGGGRALSAVRPAALLLAQSVPLMLVLFVVLPRAGALWSVPQNESAAATGVSDRMSPGDFGSLAQSDELAFRVTFEEQAPPRDQRYWRGLVLSYFDGRTWTRSERQSAGAFASWSEGAIDQWRELLDTEGEPVRYEVMLEPSHRRWVYALAAPVRWEGGELGVGREMRLQRRERVGQRIAYRVTSYPDYRLQARGLAEWERRQELQLPEQGNPRTRERAERWREQSDSPEALVERLMQHFSEGYRYTLQPPTLGEHSVDEFLWQSRAGFCEHYAGSFVFFLRAAGIPARVVVGYLGAEANSREEFWSVRQRDAHAWAEVWLEGRGWVRFDPTAAVAPARLEQGLGAALEGEDATLLDRPVGADLAWLEQVRLRWETLNFQWHRWVLGYDQRRRDSLLEGWLGGAELWRAALAALATGAVSVAGLFGWLLWRQRTRHPYPADRQLARLERKLRRAGWHRARGESPRDLARRLAPEQADGGAALSAIADLYERVNYAGQGGALTSLRRTVSRYRPRRARAERQSDRR